MELTSTSITTPDDQISIAWLQRLFERAFFTTAVDAEGDIYIKEGLKFPIWVRLIEDEKLIRFFTYMQRDPEQHGVITERSANHLNATVLLATFFVSQSEPGRLYTDYVLPYAHGVAPGQVIAAARRFAGASLYGAQKLIDLTIH